MGLQRARIEAARSRPVWLRHGPTSWTTGGTHDMCHAEQPTRGDDATMARHPTETRKSRPAGWSAAHGVRTVSVKLPIDEAERLKEWARVFGRTLDEEIKTALSLHLHWHLLWHL